MLLYSTPFRSFPLLIARLLRIGNLSFSFYFAGFLRNIKPGILGRIEFSAALIYTISIIGYHILSLLVQRETVH